MVDPMRLFVLIFSLITRLIYFKAKLIGMV